MVKLNIGCGKDIRDGYVNIDIRKTHPSVIIADVRSLPYKENSIDEIRASDVYEHVGFRESEKLLKHWVSLLKNGGKIYIHTSCFISSAKFMSESNTAEKIERAIAILFGGQDYIENTHYTIGHPVLFEKYLRNAGIKGNIVCKTGIGNGTCMEVIATK